MTLILQGSSAPFVAPSVPLSITIQEWTKRSRIVSFLVTVPPQRQIVMITAILTKANGQMIVSAVRALDANAVTGVQLQPVVTPGFYALKVQVRDNTGATATATRAKVEVVN